MHLHSAGCMTKTLVKKAEVDCVPILQMAQPCQGDFPLLSLQDTHTQNNKHFLLERLLKPGSLTRDRRESTSLLHACQQSALYCNISALSCDIFTAVGKSECRQQGEKTSPVLICLGSNSNASTLSSCSHRSSSEVKVL